MIQASNMLRKDRIEAPGALHNILMVGVGTILVNPSIVWRGCSI